MSINALELERKIIEFKKKYYSVFATTVGTDLYVWRPLNRQEYEIICKSAGGDKYLKEELVCQIAVLYPEGIQFATHDAGVPTALSPQIIEESGFGDNDNSFSNLLKYREAIHSNFIHQAEITIAAAFPQYRFEEMKLWPYEQLIEMLARAEWKLYNIDKVPDAMFEPVEEEVQEEPKTDDERLKELEQEIIKNGGDPILTLGGTVYKQMNKTDNFIKFPFVLGSSWDNENEVVMNELSRQLQRVLDKRGVL